MLNKGGPFLIQQSFYEKVFLIHLLFTPIYFNIRVSKKILIQTPHKSRPVENTDLKVDQN